MTLSTDSYGTVAGAAAYVQHAANELGTFDAETTPTLAQVEGFIDRQSARLNGWLAQNNYGVPVTNARAAAWLAYYAEIGAAGLIELTQRSSGYDDQDQNRRENKFLQEFARAQKEIASGVLAALGATTTDVPGVLFGLRVGGGTRGGQTLRPIFTRTSFGNDPTAESGSDESDYSGEY
jgi:hypothetical protein